MPPVRISSYTKILHGKVVRVNGYTTNRDAAGMAMRIPGRPFMTGTPGQFPNGRGLPNIFPVDEVHGGGAAALGVGAGGLGDPASITSRTDTGAAVKQLVASAAEKAALAAYAGPQHGAMQSALRKAKGGPPHGGPDLVNQIKAVDDLLLRSTIGSALTLWHALNLAQGGAFPRLSKGSRLTDFGFLEGTPSRSTAESAGKKGALVSIAVPQGAKGFRLGDQLESEGDGVLLPRGSQLEVTSDTDVNGQRVIETQLVPDAGNVLTQQEASQTSQRALEALRRRQQSAAA